MKIHGVTTETKVKYTHVVFKKHTLLQRQKHTTTQDVHVSCDTSASLVAHVIATPPAPDYCATHVENIND